jgi:SAM-dependent MidA family methyltransferase
LVEVGAGSGSLLAAMLPEVGEAFTATYAVEVSPAARASITERVPDVKVVSDLTEVPGGDAVIVANELLDNLPARLVERVDDKWREMCVEVGDDRLRLVAVPADAELSSWCEEHLTGVPAGSVVAAQQGFDELFVGVAKHFRSAHLAIIDYGAETSELVHRSPADVVRTFAGHTSGSDLLADPGGTDLTVEVNTDVVAATAGAAGFTVDVTDQRSWLVSLGATEELERLVAADQDHARAGDVMSQLCARSEAVGLRALLDPEGLGGFSVILATTERDA